MHSRLALESMCYKIYKIVAFLVAWMCYKNSPRETPRSGNRFSVWLSEPWPFGSKTPAALPWGKGSWDYELPRQGPDTSPTGLMHSRGGCDYILTWRKRKLDLRSLSKSHIEWVSELNSNPDSQVWLTKNLLLPWPNQEVLLASLEKSVPPKVPLFVCGLPAPASWGPTLKYLR